MRALDLDFQPRKFSPAGLALLAAGLVAAGAAFLDYNRTADEVKESRGELAKLQQPAQGRNLPRVADDRELQQVLQAANGVARDLQRPWDALFKALEEAKGEDVAFLSINPDAAKGSLQITGEAKNRGAILAFVDRLGQGSVLKNVFLAEDQRQEQDPEKPYRFLITADWAQAGTKS